MVETQTDKDPDNQASTGLEFWKHKVSDGSTQAEPQFSTAGLLPQLARDGACAAVAMGCFAGCSELAVSVWGQFRHVQGWAEGRAAGREKAGGRRSQQQIYTSDPIPHCFCPPHSLSLNLYQQHSKCEYKETQRSSGAYVGISKLSRYTGLLGFAPVALRLAGTLLWVINLPSL